MRYVLLFFCPFFSSCERRELTYFEEAEINVEVDWSRSGLSESGYGATTMFYPVDGNTPMKVLMGNREQTTVRLREGNYRVLVFNRSQDDFGSISFYGNNFYNFRAEAKQVDTRMDMEMKVETRVIIDAPEELASDTLEYFEVTEDMLGNYKNKNENPGCKSSADPYVIRLMPGKLTKKVLVEIYVPDMNNLRSAVGLIGNVCEGVYPGTGQLSEEKVTQQFTFDKMEFAPGSPFDGTISGSCNVFGFDRNLPHLLTLETLLADGKTRTKETFEAEPEYILQENGEILIRIRLTAKKLPDVKPEGVPDSGFDVIVDEWGDPEESEIPL
ncbi:MAG: DUF5119 domain-containing protein [Parabacteroides sp.]|nr:DUF5119 domain-containing protein [Parabacteroides sp.]